MNNRLILVEGLPGTGKTTLAEQLFKSLTEHGIQAEVLLEENEKSPSNFCDIAGISKSDFADIMIDVPLIAETHNYVFVNFNNCTEEIVKQLRRYDIGDEFNKFVTSQAYVHCTLEWWQKYE